MVSSNDIRGLWGTLSPFVKEHIPRPTWNDFLVVKKHPSPRHVLAENLKALLKPSKMSGPELADKAKVDRKSVNNMLNARYDPRPDNVEAVAQVFGLTGWQLLRPGTGKNIANAAQIEGLIDSFNSASPEQRVIILQVAELAATAAHHPEPDAAPPPIAAGTRRK